LLRYICPFVTFTLVTRYVYVRYVYHTHTRLRFYYTVTHVYVCYVYVDRWICYVVTFGCVLRLRLRIYGCYDLRLIYTHTFTFPTLLFDFDWLLVVTLVGWTLQFTTTLPTRLPRCGCGYVYGGSPRWFTTHVVTVAFTFTILFRLPVAVDLVVTFVVTLVAVTVYVYGYVTPFGYVPFVDFDLVVYVAFPTLVALGSLRSLRLRLFPFTLLLRTFYVWLTLNSLRLLRFTFVPVVPVTVTFTDVTLFTFTFTVRLRIYIRLPPRLFAFDLHFGLVVTVGYRVYVADFTVTFTFPFTFTFGLVTFTLVYRLQFTFGLYYVYVYG